MFAEGWEKVPGWECLFLHRQDQLFLSTYVDDFKLAGRAENIPAMWEELSKKQKLQLEPPVKSASNVYLGCQQMEITPDPQLVADHTALLEAIADSHTATDSPATKEKAKTAEAQKSGALRSTNIVILYSFFNSAIDLNYT